MAHVGIAELLEAGVHFGHQTRRWNPKMRRFIHGERDGIYIIDLLKTQALLAQAQEFAGTLAHRGGTVLFVGTKKQARDTVKEVAEAAGMPYVNHRWLGGLLTNFQTISQRIRRLHDLERYETEGQLALLPTRERMAAQADLAKLRANLGGVKNMQRVPDAMFVIDLKTEEIAVQEAQRLRIPIIGLVDTNCDPDGIDFVIPGNDDAIRSCALITQAIGEVVAEGHAIFRAEEERARKEAEETGRPRPRRAPSARPRSRPSARPRSRPRRRRQSAKRGRRARGGRSRSRGQRCRPAPAEAAQATPAAEPAAPRRQEARGRPSRSRRPRRPPAEAQQAPAAAQAAGRAGAGRGRGAGPAGGRAEQTGGSPDRRADRRPEAAEDTEQTTAESAVMSTAEISAKDVKALRERTGAGMMDCKKALTEAEGDIEKAIEILRVKQGKKIQDLGERAATEGTVQTYMHAGAKVGVLIEVDCNTDFVAKNDDFVAFAREVAMQIAATPTVALRDAARTCPQDLRDAEARIYEQEAADKPENVREKIVAGKLDTWLATIVLLDQEMHNPQARGQDDPAAARRADGDDRRERRHPPLRALRRRPVGRGAG